MAVVQVAVEGLRYRIVHAPRVRHVVGYVQPGRHLIAAVVDVTTGRGDDVAWRYEFGHAAWAEPVLDDPYVAR